MSDYSSNGDDNAPDDALTILEGSLERFNMTLVQWCDKLNVPLEEYCIGLDFTVEQARQRLGDRFGEE